MDKRCSNCKNSGGKNFCSIGGKIPEGAYYGCIEAAYTYFEPKDSEEVNAEKENLKEGDYFLVTSENNGTLGLWSDTTYKIMSDSGEHYVVALAGYDTDEHYLTRVVIRKSEAFGLQKVGYKPPLGLTPSHVHYSERIYAIISAISRYYEANKPIPKEWWKELAEILPKSKLAD